MIQEFQQAIINIKIIERKINNLLQDYEQAKKSISNLNNEIEQLKNLNKELKEKLTKYENK